MMIFCRYAITFSILVLGPLSFYLQTEKYFASVIAIVGTCLWVNGAEEEQEIVEKSHGLTRHVRALHFSNSIYGGTLVGLSSAVGALA